jgi:hypothetical protein
VFKVYSIIINVPKYVPYKVFYKLFQDSIVNNIIKDDFLRIEETIDSSENALMIETNKLSNITQKIIMFNIAMNDNCILDIEYSKPGSSEIENKFVKGEVPFPDFYRFNNISTPKIRKRNFTFYKFSSYFIKFLLK